MRHATALGLKLAAYLVIFGATMPLFGEMAFAQSLILAAVHTLLLWLADLVVLPRLGSKATLGMDALILLVGSALVLNALQAVPNPAGLGAAIALGIGFEWWFHRWLKAAAIVE